MLIPENIRKIFFNRAAALLSVIFVIFVCALLLIPSGMPEVKESYAAGQASYLSEISGVWDRMFSRSIDLGVMISDLALLLIVPLAGVCAYFGADYLVRRRTDSVIKRFFTHTKDKR